MSLVRTVMDKEGAQRLKSVLECETEMIELIKGNGLSAEAAIETNDFLISAGKNKDESIQSLTVRKFITSLIQAAREAKNMAVEEAFTSSYSYYFTSPERGFCFFDILNKPNGNKPFCQLINFNITLPGDKLNQSAIKVNYVMTVFGLSDAEARKFKIEMNKQRRVIQLNYVFPDMKTVTNAELPNIQCKYVLDQNDLNIEEKYYVLKAIQQRDLKGMLEKIYNSIIANRDSTIMREQGLFAVDEETKPEIRITALPHYFP